MSIKKDLNIKAILLRLVILVLTLFILLKGGAISFFTLIIFLIGFSAVCGYSKTPVYLLLPFFVLGISFAYFLITKGWVENIIILLIIKSFYLAFYALLCLLVLGLFVENQKYLVFLTPFLFLFISLHHRLNRNLSPDAVLKIDGHYLIRDGEITPHGIYAYVTESIEYSLLVLLAGVLFFAIELHYKRGATK